MPKTPPLRGGGGGKGGFRGKKKKKSKGPQLPKFVQEQLASREAAKAAESSDGFGNANFRGREKKAMSTAAALMMMTMTTTMKKTGKNTDEDKEEDSKVSEDGRRRCPENKRGRR